jgi:hypothetical protein
MGWFHDGNGKEIFDLLIWVKQSSWHNHDINGIVHGTRLSGDMAGGLIGNSWHNDPVLNISTTGSFDNCRKNVVHGCNG